MDAAQLEQLRKMGGHMNAADIPKLVRAYIYGDPGTGKTDLTARICEEACLNPIWVHSDSGFSTVFKFPKLADRTYFVPFDSFAHIRLLVQAREEGIEPFCNYDTLVWDTASTGTNEMLRTVVASNPLPPGEQKHPSIEGWAHYRMVESAMKDTVSALSKSSMNVFYLAHIRDPTQQDKEKKRFAIRPAGPEATYRVIAQEVNLIGWLYKENQGRRQIQFSPTLQETAKTQLPTIEEKTYLVNQVPELINKYIHS